MANIGVIRCEKNEGHCPLTSCLKSLRNMKEGFSSYENAELIGVFTCRCPGNSLGSMAKILKSKGADAIHFCTCTFAHREDGKWVGGGGYCDELDTLLQHLSTEVDIPCVKGTAHLPEGYKVEAFKEK